MAITDASHHHLFFLIFSSSPPSVFALFLVISSFMCAERTFRSSPIVTTTASCKPITTGFIVFVVHRVIESLYSCWCFVAELRCGGESDVGAAALHRHSTLESSQSIGDPHRYHMSRTKPPMLRSEQMRSPSTLACVPRIFFLTFNRPLISTTCLEPPDTYEMKMMNQMNLTGMIELKLTGIC